MEKKQTAIEWLVEHIKSDQNQKALSAIEWLDIIKQAKQMEKDQIIDAHNEGFNDGYNDAKSGFEPIFEDAEQYYDETYGMGRHT